ncbi:hypothetical protein FJR11_20280 [Anabaena sp. UHCC 0187]|uniref:hypothetical protein n=1 Tax=Anabaena sp. UHCC 0187 TaxID=2590018 RepID=UPI001446E58F|nr:hypothetical protein [Anabaena sp. UHCC 0187]MTJ14870.1 hypothetical protein [Anabaena sp. UHCC 0187]
MPVHCQAGDIARVTFPDGSIQDFTDTPISVTIESDDLTCQARWNFEFTYTHVGDSRTQRKSLGTYWTKYYGYRIIRPITSSGFGYAVEILSHGAALWTCSQTAIWERIITVSGGFIENPVFTSLGLSYKAPAYTLKYKISVYSATGNLLFSGTYNSAIYTVECIQGCPPNTLDCGDCCLDCASIFNGISAIRKILAGIK